VANNEHAKLSASPAGFAITAYNLAVKHFPKSLVGRVAVSIGAVWLVLVTVLGISFGIWDAIWGARERQNYAEAVAGEQRARRALDSAIEQTRGYEAMRDSVIKDGDYQRAVRETGR
jgi:hypothetical protein